jgi:hypothetical protein
MKKLHITLVALFMFIAAQAQAITEKDLIGEWVPSKIIVQGTTIDFKTGDVTFSDEAKEQAEASGEDLEGAKEMIKEGISSQLGGIRVLFKTGLKVEFHRPDSVKDLTYTLAQDGTTTYIKRSDSKEMTVSLVNGLLKIEPRGEDIGPAEIFFEKKK